MYPIINLRNHKMDLHWYLRKLEEVVIRVLSSAFAINASRLDGFTGVWVGMFVHNLHFLLWFDLILASELIHMYLYRQQKNGGDRYSCVEMDDISWSSS